MSNVMSFPTPRAVRPAPAPLGLYLRAGRNDHRVLRDLIVAGDAACSGLVIDPTLLDRHAELRGLATQYGLDLVLDPLTQPAATPGGFRRAIGSLPWSVANRPHTTSDFEGANGRRAIDALADFGIEHGFTQVLAPTHLLQSANDPWLNIDVEMARRLQDRLARGSGASVPVIYSLAVPYRVFRDEGQRERLVEALGTVPASAVWLKIDGLGSASSGAATRAYIQAASDLHQLDIPVIADQMGGMPGLALMAFGAVGGIAHGVTLGERFSASSWRRSPQSSGFTPSWRVYVQPISMMLTKDEAAALLGASRQTRGWFGCRDSHCCPRGVDDMLARPARHFLCRRIEEVAGLNREPETIRAQQFLEHYVRPASDQAVRAANINWEGTPMGNGMKKKMQGNRKSLDSLRQALGEHVRRAPPRTFAVLPPTRAAREARP